MRRDGWQKLVKNVLLALAAYVLASSALAANGVPKLPAGTQAGQSNSASSARDRSQWRKLHRRMSKDDVKRLLGEPDRISVSRFYEAWEFGGGSVTFDGKGKVDSWTEP